MLGVLLEEKLQKALPSHIFLDRMRVIAETSRKTSAYSNPRYVPVYYWLGTMLQPTALLEVGIRLGLFSANFLRACKTVNNVLGYQEKTEEYYSPKLAKANIRDHYKKKLNIYVGAVHDEQFQMLLATSKWDLALVNEEVSYDKHREYLDVIWENLNIDGILVMDYLTYHKPAKEAFVDFCKASNREPVFITTRYGVGIVNK